MSGETRVVVHRRGRAEIARLARTYQTSGLGRSEFCRQHGLALSTLSRHLRKQSKEETRHDSVVAGRSSLVEVKLTEVGPVGDVDRAAALKVLLSNGRRVEVGDGFAEQTLRRLVAVLERW